MTLLRGERSVPMEEVGQVKKKSKGKESRFVRRKTMIQLDVGTIGLLLKEKKNL